MQNCINTLVHNLQIYLRLAKSQKTSTLINRVFVSKKPVELSLYPIPDWLKDAICGCGQKGDYLSENMKPVCQKCLEQIFIEASGKLEEQKDVSIPLTERTIKRLRFEWSTDERRWYFVRGANLKPNNWDWFIKEVRRSVIDNEVLFLDAEYNKEAKELTIY